MTELRAAAGAQGQIEAAVASADAVALPAEGEASAVWAAQRQEPVILERLKKLRKTGKTGRPVPQLFCKRDTRFQRGPLLPVSAWEEEAPELAALVSALMGAVVAEPEVALAWGSALKDAVEQVAEEQEPH